MKPSIFIWTILLVGLVFILSSCASSSIGRKFDTTHVNDIEKGVSTKEIIRQWFGKPYATGAAETELRAVGCVEGWSYLYAYLTTSESLAVYFDADGKVCANAYVKNN